MCIVSYLKMLVTVIVTLVTLDKTPQIRVCIIDIILKISCLMACTTCLIFLVGNISVHCKILLWKASASSGHKTKQPGWQSSQGCLICIRSACFVLRLLLGPLFCWSGCFQANMCWAIYFLLDIYGLYTLATFVDEIDSCLAPQKGMPYSPWQPWYICRIAQGGQGK